MGVLHVTGRNAGLLVLAIGAAGCAFAQLDQSPPATGTQCVDDSADCVGKRQSALKGMMADSSKGWVKEPADAKAYASGVRLFAWRGKRKDLTCDELTIGRRETDGASAVLKGPTATGLTPAQISRGTMLAAEVSRELAAEMGKRCKKA